jgi:hypothetical protein
MIAGSSSRPRDARTARDHVLADDDARRPVSLVAAVTPVPGQRDPFMITRD